MNGNDLRREFGDYQTPEDFAEVVCKYLHSDLGINPRYVIEPTAGIGNFIKASNKVFDSVESIVGIEINENYCDICKTTIVDKKVTIECANFFGYDLEEHAKKGD